MANASNATNHKWETISPREMIRRRYFPNLQLTTHEGKQVRLYDDLIKDKMVVMNFMYSRCTGVCTPVGANLRRVQKIFGPRVGRDMFFYSFTLKPEEDTPEALNDYAKRLDAGPGWYFLTGAPGDMEHLRRCLGFTDPDPARDADKSNHTGLVRYGNEPLQLWAACPGGINTPKSLAHSISFVDWPERRGVI
jgi:protein SCO1/2